MSLPAYIVTLFLFSARPILATQAPPLLLIHTRVPDCTYNITALVAVPTPPSSNTNVTTIDVLFDTATSPPGAPDALAWTDSAADSYGALCTVCLDLRLGEGAKHGANGSIASLDYDFWHRLDPGLLEQVTSHLRRPKDAGEQWFETSYIYGIVETAAVQRVQTNIPIGSDPLTLYLASNSTETICVETSFAVYNRVGVQGAYGEISRRSVFKLSVNLQWDE